MSKDSQKPSAPHEAPSTDPSDSMIVAVSDRGRIDRDERGRAQWKWATETDKPPDPNAETFRFLKALDVLELLEDKPPTSAEPVAPKGGGYNPYEKSK